MNDKINNLIPIAIDAIRVSGMANSSDAVQSEYKGYISSMGASIIQAGLLPTLAFNSNSTGKAADSKKLLDAIHYILEGPTAGKNNLITYVITTAKNQNASFPVSVREMDVYKLGNCETDIGDALIALKLALRTFKLLPPKK